MKIQADPCIFSSLFGKKNMVILSFKGNLLIIRSSQYYVIIKLWIWYKVKFFPSWGLLQIESLRRGLAPFSLSQTFVSALPLPFYSIFWLCWSRGRKGGRCGTGVFVDSGFGWCFSGYFHCFLEYSAIVGDTHHPFSWFRGMNPPLTYSLWLLLALWLACRASQLKSFCNLWYIKYDLTVFAAPLVTRQNPRPYSVNVGWTSGLLW